MDTLHQQRTTGGDTLAPRANLFERAADVASHVFRLWPEDAPSRNSTHTESTRPHMNDLTAVRGEHPAWLGFTADGLPKVG